MPTTEGQQMKPTIPTYRQELPRTKAFRDCCNRRHSRSVSSGVHSTESRLLKTGYHGADMPSLPGYNRMNKKTADPILIPNQGLWKSVL